MKKKILMTGVGGMLGEAFYHIFKDQYQLHCTDIDVNDTWLSYLDFRSYNDYLRVALEFQPDYIFHIGAHTSLEYCEININEAYFTNTLSVENAVLIANKLDVPIFYVSTAGIFDGNKEYYDDWDSPSPICHYGRSKYMGECFVAQNAHRFLVCRAGWMMGSGPKKDKKFINKIAQQVRNGASELYIVDDKLGTPTYTKDFAKQVKILIDNELWGIYNVVCTGQTGRLEVAKYFLSCIERTNQVTIHPVSSEYFSNEYFAPRPNSERLLSSKLDMRGINIMRDWRLCLREYVSEYYSDLVI